MSYKNMVCLWSILKYEDYLNNYNLILDSILTFKDKLNTYSNMELVSFNKEEIEDMIKAYVLSKRVIGFKNKSGDLVGICAYNIGSPWYNPKMKVMEELFTLSFARGANLVHSVAGALSYLARGNKCKLVLMANGSPINSKLYDNAMKKIECNWNSYKTYYKVI